MSETHKTADPCVMVIFGATGDLTKRKLFPALYNLAKDDFLPHTFAIIGVGRQEMETKDFRRQVVDDLKEFVPNGPDAKLLKWFEERAYYTGGDFDDDKKLFHDLKELIGQVCAEHQIPENYFYYLATPPSLFANVAQKIVKNGLGKEDNGNWRRFIFEKPFGHDLDSAKSLNASLLKILKEKQIYRIDHYLGKETVQNIIALRFANALFEPIWNRNYIDHVQITAAETVGSEGRGAYYEGAGTLRDMVQNHILQLICMIAMEAPVSFDADEIRNKKVDVLNAVRRIHREEVSKFAVRGQYSGGWMEGEKVPAYREEKNVDPKSTVDTFAAVKFYIDNWRWQDVPFYIRTGKRLHEKTTIINIQFKAAPSYAFPPEAAETWRANRLTISIQPEMDIRIRFQSKRPGQYMSLNPVDMIFRYKDAYDGNEPEAYETLLLDVMEGNATLFMRKDQVEAAWKIIMPILEAWKNRPPVDFPNYAPGSWGPEDAEALIARDGHQWIVM